MMRFTNQIIAVVTGVIITVTIGGCGKIKQTDQAEVGKVRADVKRQKATCASSGAYARLKRLMFDQAVLRHEGNRANLDTLADYTVARMEDPVVQGWDPALDVTRCAGRFILEIPPGAERGFDGERRLQANIDYSAQATADGAGYAYKLNGADAMVAKLAAFHLTSGGFGPPAAIDSEDAGSDAPDDAVAASAYPSSANAEEEAPTQRPSRRRDLEREGALEAPGPSPASSARKTGEGAIRAFYGALGVGDGAFASAQMIPEKRSSAAFAPQAMSRFYGQLSEPIRLTSIEPLSSSAYRVSYRYSAGRSRCEGSAVVRLVDRNGRDFIQSIRALTGC